MTADSTFDIKGTTISDRDLVLDLGTKDGSNLSGCPGTVVGIDIDSSQFPEDTETEFLLGDGRQLPFDTNVFDYVYCSVVLEHVDGSGPLIAEAARVLKPSGIAYFSFPNRISLLQPHSSFPRYYSLLPKPIGRLLSRYLLSEEKAEYYERALFPLTPITARRHLHANFEKVDYTIRMSGEMITDSPWIQQLFQAANSVVTKPPFKWPYELIWPNAAYRCKEPNSAFRKRF